MVPSLCLWVLCCDWLFSTLPGTSRLGICFGRVRYDLCCIVAVFLFCLIIIVNNNSKTCLWCCHHGRATTRVHPVHLMNVEWHQVATDPRPRQTTWVVQAAGIFIHHCHLLLLLSPKANTHFIVPRRVEGRVNLVGWLHTEMVFTCPQATDDHLFWY